MSKELTFVNGDVRDADRDDEADVAEEDENDDEDSTE